MEGSEGVWGCGEKRGSLEFVGHNGINGWGSLKRSSKVEGVIWSAEWCEEDWSWGSSKGVGDSASLKME